MELFELMPSEISRNIQCWRKNDQIHDKMLELIVSYSSSSFYDNLHSFGYKFLKVKAIFFIKVVPATINKNICYFLFTAKKNKKQV